MLPLRNQDMTLDAPISEFSEALQHFPKNKATGPDGFPLALR